MLSVSALRRRGRQAVLARLSARAFDHKIVQALLGYVKHGSQITDTLPDLHIEYAYASAIGQSLFFLGTFEDDEIKFFSSLLAHEAAPVVLDIGANIGLHSLRWAKANHHAALYAFEPSPATRDILKRNVQRNFLDGKITIVPLAVSSQSGRAQFFTCADNAFSSLKDTRREPVIGIIEVAVTTIDAFVAHAHLDKLSLVKIDVEGFENEVILGAINTLRSLKPDLFVEIYGGTHSNPDPEGTVQLISGLGYRAFVFVNGQPAAYERHLDAQYNYYFTCREFS